MLGDCVHHLCPPALQPLLLEATGGLADLCPAPLLFAEGWDPPPASNQSMANEQGRLLRLH